jgi:uncharacterized protein (TIGR01370 family)
LTELQAILETLLRSASNCFRRACAPPIAAFAMIVAPWGSATVSAESLHHETTACVPQGGEGAALSKTEWSARGFGVQYWGEGYTADALAGSPHGLLIIEATKVGAQYSATGREELFSAEEIFEIRKGGARPVLGYINLSEIETYRDYWVEMASARGEDPGASVLDPPPVWFGALTTAGEQLAAFWTPEWEAILKERVDRLLALGLDGVFLDDVLHYYGWAVGQDLQMVDGVDLAGAPEGATGFARAMMGLVERLAAHAKSRRCDVAFIVNNGAFIGRDAGPDGEPDDGNEGARSAFDRYRDAIGGIMSESTLAPERQDKTIEALREDFVEHGVPVLTVDLASRAPDLSAQKFRALVAERAGEAGFIPYVADDEAFDRLYPPLTAEMPDPSR